MNILEIFEKKINDTLDNCHGGQCIECSESEANELITLHRKEIEHMTGEQLDIKDAITRAKDGVEGIYYRGIKLKIK